MSVEDTLLARDHAVNVVRLALNAMESLLLGVSTVASGNRIHQLVLVRSFMFFLYLLLDLGAGCRRLPPSSEYT